MISLCLLLMLALVAMRPNSLLKPSWVATLTGALSIATWISPTFLDSFIGGSNLLTLVRDVLAVLSFWFYREAVTRATGKRPTGDVRFGPSRMRRIPWSLVALIGLFAVPFALIADRGTTSPRFVMHRLDQPAMWLFASLYMLVLILLSVDTVRMLIGAKNVRLRIILAGYGIVIVGCVVEIAYLAAAHFGWGGASFRSSMYFAAELPFFTGIFLIGVAIAWNALATWGRFRFTLLRMFDLGRRVDKDLAPRNRFLAVIGSPFPRRDAYRHLISIQNAVVRGAAISAADTRVLGQIARRFDPSDEHDPMASTTLQGGSPA